MWRALHRPFELVASVNSLSEGLADWGSNVRLWESELDS